MRRRAERGLALVLVTWIFMILGVLALDFARYMRDDAVAALNLAEETRNYYVAVGAMNRAFYGLEQSEGGAGDDDDDEEEEGEDGDADHELDADGFGAEALDLEALSEADGEWREDVFQGIRYAVRVTDERGRISLNDAAREEPPEVLRLVVRNLLGYGGTAGVDRRGEAAVSAVVDSIRDWVDADDEARPNGAETAYYAALAPGYPAKNGNFQSLEELLQVRGVTPELYFGTEGVPGLKDVFTPYVHGSDHPRVNVMHAPAEVFQALLGVDAEEVAELLDLREELDANAFLAEVLGRIRAVDPAVAQRLLRQQGGEKIFRVDARANTAAPRNQARVSAIVELSSEVTEGVRVIRWFDRAPWEGALPATTTGDAPA